MKIAMISIPCLRVPPRGYGGTELVVHELVGGLVRRGHEVTLFVTGDCLTESTLAYASVPLHVRARSLRGIHVTSVFPLGP